MARAGLGPKWHCLFANDFDHKKCQTYIKNWGAENLKTADVRTVTVTDLPGTPNLVWASFPCQDLSLAGGGAGLRGERSGTFWPFWNLVESLVASGRVPDFIVLENVVGTITSHGGRDFETICAAFADIDFRCGAMVVDAKLFLPQSRPRLFVIGVRHGVDVTSVTTDQPSQVWHPRRLQAAVEGFPLPIRTNWVWWDMPKPHKRVQCLEDLIEDAPSDVEWHSPEETERLISMMNDVHLAKLEEAKKKGTKVVGTVYRRTRRDERGARVQRAEVRFDGIAGCLRTPAGGSSRQIIIVVDGSRVRSRLISSRETARLMGLPDSYQLPGNYNEAYHLTGDGVAVPVVRHIAAHILEPIILAESEARSVVA